MNLTPRLVRRCAQASAVAVAACLVTLGAMAQIALADTATPKRAAKSAVELRIEGAGGLTPLLRLTVKADARELTCANAAPTTTRCIQTSTRTLDKTLQQFDQQLSKQRFARAALSGPANAERRIYRPISSDSACPHEVSIELASASIAQSANDLPTIGQQFLLIRYQPNQLCFGVR